MRLKGLRDREGVTLDTKRLKLIDKLMLCDCWEDTRFLVLGWLNNE